MELSSFDLKNYMTNTAVKIMYERNFINMHLEQMDILGVHNNVYIKGSFDRLVYFYDELKKAPDDNPTIGIVLCSETDEDIARYSVLKGNEQLFASKYKFVGVIK